MASDQQTANMSTTLTMTGKIPVMLIMPPRTSSATTVSAYQATKIFWELGLSTAEIFFIAMSA